MTVRSHCAPTSVSRSRLRLSASKLSPLTNILIWEYKKGERWKVDEPPTRRDQWTTTRLKNMNTPPIVSPQEWEAARQQLLVKEKELTRARDALAAERRRMPWLAVEKAYEFDGPHGQGEPARPVRGPPSADRLPRLLRARRVRLARACLPRLLLGGRPGRPPRPSERPRHHARVRLARAAGGHRAPEGADGLGDAVVHHHRQLRRRLRRGRVARPNVFIRDGDRVFRTYFINNRGDEAMGSTWSYLDLTRARAPGGVGGLAGGLPPDPAVQVVELARRIRRRATRPEVGQGAGQRTGDVTPVRRVFAAGDSLNAES